MSQLNRKGIDLLRTMAQEGRSVAEMARSILAGSDVSFRDSILVLRYFRGAFSLTLPQAKPVADWVAYGVDEAGESELHTLVWPYIEANRHSWGQPSTDPLTNENGSARQSEVAGLGSTESK